jgi:hypothetical protein
MSKKYQDTFGTMGYFD